MPCDAMRNAAAGSDDVDIGVAFKTRGVGDLRAVGRVIRTGDDMAIGGETLGFATLTADGPNVVGVEECDFVLRERGIAQQKRRLGKSRSECRESERQQKRQTGETT